MKRAVIGVLLNDKNQILLIKRRDVPFVWVLPGGGVDSHESPENAMIREAQEETGYKVVIQRKISEYTPLNKLAQPTDFFECRIVGGEAELGEETKAIDFFAIGALPKDLFIVHQDWIADFALGEKSVLQKPIWRVTYWELTKYFLKHPVQVIRLLLSRLGMPINRK